MLPLDDPRWATYIGGYQTPYDASEALRRLYAEGPSKELWDELWQELHHQGDIGSASFAAVPHLLEFSRKSPTLDWNAFGLIAIIELERLGRSKHWTIPPELEEAFFAAIEKLPEIVASHPQKRWGPELTQHIMACIAVARGQTLLARAYLEMGLDEAKQLLRDVMGFYAEKLKNGRNDFIWKLLPTLHS